MLTIRFYIAKLLTFELYERQYYQGIPITYPQGENRILLAFPKKKYANGTTYFVAKVDIQSQSSSIHMNIKNFRVH
jgi:hypothetical protein